MVKSVQTPTSIKLKDWLSNLLKGKQIYQK